MGVKLNTASGGSVSIEPTNTASNFTLTVPAQTGSLVTANADGNVGIGTSSPASILDVTKSTDTKVRIKTSGASTTAGIDIAGANATVDTDNVILYQGGSKECYLYNRANSEIRFGTNNTERMRIDSSGNLVMASRSGGGNTAQLQVGTTSILGTSINAYGQFGGDSGTPYPLGVKGNSSSQGMVGFFDSANSVIGSISKSGSSVAYNTSSDYRLKENIAPMVGALAKVSALKPVTYTWKADGSNGQGFIAHELQEVVPDCVTGEKDAIETYTDEDGIEQTRIKPQGIDTSFLVATLTAAIQEQQAIITDLKAEVDLLKSEVTALKGQA